MLGAVVTRHIGHLPQTVAAATTTTLVTTMAPPAPPCESGDAKDVLLATCNGSTAGEPRKRQLEKEAEERERRELELKQQEQEELVKPYTSPLVWKNVITFVILHLLAVYAAFIGFWSAEGVLMGAHRLYSHKSFKASWQFRALLVGLQTVAGQNCMYIWVRDHRLHHKYSDTNADPHNARRGFWFSHVGWLNMKKHPLVIKKGRQIDLSDLERDSIVMFQKRYYKSLYVLLALVLPVYVPCALWNEYWVDSLMCAYFVRYVIVLNLTWTVNSAAHLWGVRPYDKDIMPAENPYVGFWGMGEGWHNYHHAFPWDYRAAEWGVHYSPTTRIIDWFARRGWAYDLKSASADMVKRRIQRTGDLSHLEQQEHHHHIEEAEPDPEEVNNPENAPEQNGKAQDIRHRA
ncbi:hypothetical protein B566_EDAN014055 [Ephemera danica]|nr:hypothetical protein B566_EDAN014055 [Ephemera danica]